MKSFPDFSYELESGGRCVAGVDEAGRGPLCGPVVAAAVVFNNLQSAKRKARTNGMPREPRRQNSIELRALRFANSPLITDSKKMSPAQRATAFDWIMKNCAVGVGQCSPEEIDKINILQASLLAMKRAIAALPCALDFALVDGNKMPDGIVGRAIVKGDGKSLSIAAASIVAKETRDKIMRGLAREFPKYGWEKNAGYPTAAHLRAMAEFGINEHYRKSYRPVKEIMVKSQIPPC